MKNHHPVPEPRKLDADWLTLRSPSCPTALRSITLQTHFSTHKSSTFLAKIHRFPAQVIFPNKLVHFSPENSTLESKLENLLKRLSNVQPIRSAVLIFAFGRTHTTAVMRPLLTHTGENSTFCLLLLVHWCA